MLGVLAHTIKIQRRQTDAEILPGVYGHLTETLSIFLLHMVHISCSCSFSHDDTVNVRSGFPSLHTMLVLYKSLKTAFAGLLVSGTVYLVLLGFLAGFPALQTHVFYLHRVTLTWLKDLTIPEQFGFAPRQVTSFYIESEQNERLHAWHVLPLGLYRRNLSFLLSDENAESNHKRPSTALDLLKNDPEAHLVLYFHGTAGCLASGWRPDSYRTIYAAAPDHIHVLSFDYRGYGLSSGTPSEEGLLQDGRAAVEWALNVAGIPPSRIVIYGQSLGTAVALALMQHYASLPEPILFAGHVLTASFSDVATLTATYRIGGIIPVLSPLAKIPPLLAFFNSFLTNTWMSKDRIAEFVRLREASNTGPRYYINLIHAEDDSDITCEHSNVLFWHAINASSSAALTFDQLDKQKSLTRKDLGHGGWVTEHRTDRGLVRQTMLNYGVHDKLMSYPVTSLAVLEAFQNTDPSFMK